MNDEIRTLESEASEWLIRCQRGLSPAEQSAFSRWLESNPEHSAAFKQVETTWVALDRLGESRLAKEFEGELDELPDLQTRKRTVWRAGLSLFGTAVACAALYIAWWRPMQLNRSYVGSLATEVGASQSLDLPDGSQIRLNTDSAVDVDYSDNQRHVTLRRGEALFTVAKNKERPFIVQAAGIDVRAVGTAFNVRLRSEAVEVLVTEGKVSLNQEAPVIPRVAAPVSAPVITGPKSPTFGYLEAGQRLSVPRQDAGASAEKETSPAAPIAPVVVQKEEIDRALAWRDKRLSFDSTPLAEIVAEFNRYNQKQLVIVDPELAHRRFAGTFQANDPQTLVVLLQASYHVSVEEHASETRLSLSAK